MARRRPWLMACALLALLLCPALAGAQERPKSESFRKLLDLARRLRAQGRYDAAVASYTRAADFAIDGELAKRVVLEAGEVLEFQRKYKKALQSYKAARLRKAEIELLLRLRDYKQACQLARMFGETRLEGEILLASGQPKEALKVFRLGEERYGEARALFALGFGGKAAIVFATLGKHGEAATSFASVGQPGSAREQWMLGKARAEKRLVRLINEIRLLRRTADPRRRSEARLPELSAERARILRIRLAALYKASADSYEELAKVQQALDDNITAQKLRQQLLKFLELYRVAYTDSGRDRFGVDRLERSGFKDIVTAIEKSLAKKE